MRSWRSLRWTPFALLALALGPATATTADLQHKATPPVPPGSTQGPTPVGAEGGGRQRPYH